MSGRERRRMPPAAGLTSEERLMHEDFARRLHKLMIERGMSQSELARAVWGEIERKDHRGNIVLKGDGEPQMVARNRDRISVYLSGKGFPDQKNLAAIAKALRTTPEELAPDLVGAAVERESPEQSMTAIAGHPEKVLLRINKLLPLDVALRALNVINNIRNDNHNHNHNHNQK